MKEFTYSSSLFMREIHKLRQTSTVRRVVEAVTMLASGFLPFSDRPMRLLISFAILGTIAIAIVGACALQAARATSRWWRGLD